MQALRTYFEARPHLQFLCDFVEALTERCGGVTSSRRLLIDADGAPLAVATTFAAETYSGAPAREDVEERGFLLLDELVQITVLLGAGAYDTHELDQLEERARLISRSITDTVSEYIVEEAGTTPDRVRLH